MLDLVQNSPPKVKIATLTTIKNSEQEIGKTHSCSILQVPTTQLANK